MDKVKELTPDKVSMFRDYDDVMKRIIQEETKEVAELQRQKGNLVLGNRELEDKLTRQQSQFEQWKRMEEQKLTELKNKMNNDIIRREKAIEIGELDMKRRSEEISRREEIGKTILGKETRLYNDRLDVEKLRVSASVLMEDANRKMSDASSMYSQANVTNQKAQDTMNKANLLNDTIIKREGIVSEKEKEILLQSKNLEELRKVIDPKLSELKILEDKLATQVAELKKKEELVNSKIVEEKSFLRSLEDRENKLIERQKELNQKDEDITRKALISGIKDA